MIVDTSALIALLKGERDSDEMLAAMVEASGVRISAATYLETAIVVDALGDPVKSRRFDDLVDALAIEIVSAGVEHVRVARAAYRDYGRGSGHPARLNFGDCFSYALARITGEPLLFKGEDFTHTDVTPALRP